MYDELVKRLRKTSCGAEDTLWWQAADAIEELAKDLERSKDYEAFWQHEAEEALKKFQVAISNKSRWIPVTERLPEEMDQSCGGWSAEIRPSDDVLAWLSSEKRRTVVVFSRLQ